MRPAQVRPNDGGIHQVHRARRRGRVQQVCRRADDLRLRDRAVDGTRPRGAPMAGHRHIGGFFPRGDTSNDVTLVATGTQQYRRGSRHATSEWGLCVTFPRDTALEAVSSEDRTTFGSYTACGLQARSHPQTHLMASRAVVYSAPHTVMEQEGWYTTTEPFSTPPPSRNNSTATCGSCGTLDIRTTSATEHSSASGTGPAGSRRTIAHLLHPCTAAHALENAGRPCTTPKGDGFMPPPYVAYVA